MRLYERPNSPYWWYEFKIDGEKYRGSTKRLIRDKPQANQVMIDLYNRIMNENQFGQKPQITLGEACGNIVDAAEKEKTRQSYDLCRRKLLGDYKPSAIWHISPDMMFHDLRQKHVNDLKKHRRHEGLKNNSVNIELRFLRSVYFGHLRSHMATPDLVFEELSKFVRKRHFTPTQEAEVLRRLGDRAGSSAYDKAALLFVYLIDTGVRLEEALQQDWYNIELDNRTVMTYQPKTGDYSPQPMTERLAEALQRVHNQSTPFEGMTRAVKVLRRVIDEVCNQNPRQVERLGKMVLHSCRDTFVTRLHDEGMGLDRIGKLVGHGSITTTEKYSHLDKRKIADEAREIMRRTG